ncbi:DUF2155 domain-containing protein [Pseudosulfitobacter sp. DSM 107133]|uniref:DUF2155 domain-containing protein n=1 Tax=Pseudosulfitobacter sp. DSM 107133 TaxID=2883100 RepID=UPI001F072CA2|nr:DUF2155 domain-containing protein [Pseudosulfitobacter sp. DSM 107133]UOA27789.1 hypothetical protein DSM107133_02528 [Pseudosulfitobacter sp. DSM 107133]
MKHLLAGLWLMALALPAAAQETSNASGAVLRGLDTFNGHVTDMQVAAGESVQFGRLNIVLRECRYPAGNPSGDAFASLEISQQGRAGVLFSGWMVASSPALNAMEHPRYDVWVLRCTTS